MLARAAFAFATLLVATPAAAQDPATWRYILRSEDGRHLEFTLCGGRLPALVVELPDATDRSAWSGLRRGDAPLALDEARIRFDDWGAGECLAWRVDLDRIPARGRRRATLEGARLVHPDALLARPLERGPRVLDAELAPGLRLSVPWAPLSANRYDVPRMEPGWPATLAIGRFDARRIDVAPRGTVRLALTGITAPEHRERLARYTGETADDVAAVLPSTFESDPQLLTVPARSGRDAVPFGQSQRGGGTAIVLLVDPARTLADLHDSWTLAHELVHVAHPYLGDEGRWISEGIATYYQNVVRARAGRITAREAWAELHAGFGRGRAQRRDDLTLREGSRLADAQRLYMRTYWSGTALMLRADLALRTRARRPTTLEALVDAYARCCRAPGQWRRPRAYLAELDRLGGDGVLVALYDAHADGTAFPSLDEAYALLGLSERDGRLVFSSDARGRARRVAIMGTD